MWGKAAESLSPILKKGMPVTVTGQCITEPYKTRDAGESPPTSRSLRAEVGLINTGNGTGAPAAADDGEAPVVIANGAAPSPATMSVPTQRPHGQRPAAGHEPAPVLVR